MHAFHDSAPGDTSRRRFITQTSLAVAGLAAAGASDAFTDGKAAIRIGVIGCGGRGTGAMLDALGAATKVIYPTEGYHTEDVAEGTRAAHENIEVVALADLFPDRLARARDQLNKLGMEIPEARTFTGFEAYKQLLAVPEINYVILATPPHFRPQHLMAAVQAGKHVFMEKPCAVDVPGVRLVMEAGMLAAQKKLGDHFAVEFEYPNGVSAFSQCRQINGCQNIVGEHVVGTLGTSNCANRIDPAQGEKWRFSGSQASPYRLTHEDLIASILAGTPINEAQVVAESTMTGILGREAVYSGRAVTWDKAMQSEARLGPAEYAMASYPIPPVAMPGQYQFE